MASPKPKPTAVKKLQGNPGKRALNKREPITGPLSATPPSWMDTDQKRIWREVVKGAHPGLLQQTDKQLVIRYVLSLTYLRTAAAQIASGEGILYVSADTGYETPRGSVSVFRGLAADLLKMEGEMGFTPSSRSKIELPQLPDGSDPWVKLVK